MSERLKKPALPWPAAFDPVSAQVLTGFVARVAFFVGIDALVALADPHPLVRFLTSLGTIFSIAAILSTLVGLFHRQHLQGPTLTSFDEAVAFIGLQILTGAALAGVTA